MGRGGVESGWGGGGAAPEGLRRVREERGRLERRGWKPGRDAMVGFLYSAGWPPARQSPEHALDSCPLL